MAVITQSSSTIFTTQRNRDAFLSADCSKSGDKYVPIRITVDHPATATANYLDAINDEPVTLAPSQRGDAATCEPTGAECAISGCGSGMSA